MGLSKYQRAADKLRNATPEDAEVTVVERPHGPPPQSYQPAGTNLDDTEELERAIAVILPVADNVDLNDLRVAATDAGVRITHEEYREGASEMVRLYEVTDLQTTPAWYKATEELIALSAEHSPTEVLDYWMAQRAAPMHETQSQSAWARHRTGGRQSNVSRNVTEVNEGPVDVA